MLICYFVGMKSSEIRDRFLKFFEARNHTVIPSASVVPENDPSSLFTTAGMQPLVPYLLGQVHPAGRRLVNVQKCIRTNDIDEVGDATHLTFFQMLGNWSLGSTTEGGYGKAEAIKWSYEFLTTSEGLGLDPNRLYITVFAGDENAPRDDEAAEIWKSIGVPDHRIYYLDGKSNWWSPGDNGPCGPSSEMFYDLTDEGLGDLSHDEFLASEDAQKLVEIWNDVFMEYQKKDGVVIGPLTQKNIDTGAGLERLSIMLQKKKTIYETDMFEEAMFHLGSFARTFNDKDARIIADHIRSAVIMISDGVVPSNTDQGYILRRLIRRSYIKARNLDLKELETDHLVIVAQIFFRLLSSSYSLDQSLVEKTLESEINKFAKALKLGLKEFEKVSLVGISGKDAFKLFTTHGFPIELTVELAKERDKKVDIVEFEKLMADHQDISKSGSDQKFKGGLAGDDEMSVKYHTATHLLHAALREILGAHVEQRGSNITPDRLRFDFSHPDRLTDEQKGRLEDWVNDKINQSLPVVVTTENKSHAIKSGAIALFADKYGDEVSVYTIGDPGGKWCSKELCGGPHVDNAGELGTFKIQKEEAASAGVRRIKAVLMK